MALAPLADLKTYLGIDNTDSDAELTRMLEVQSGFAEQYMGRSIVRASFTERRNGNCSDVLFVRNAPISAISLLTINGATIAASDGTSSGYIFEAESVFLLGGQRFTRGTKNVVITYTGGYQTVPPEIAHSVVEMAAQAYREKEWIGFTSKSLAGETVAFQRNGFPDSAKNTLNFYRRLYSCD